MIDSNSVRAIVDGWLEGKEYFLVDLTVSADNQITVEIDHREGVWIEDCVALSRYIESRLSREEEDYGLEVGSAGIAQPFKVMQQWLNHVGRQVELRLTDGKRLTGKLLAVDQEQLQIEVEVRVKPEGAKRPRNERQTLTLQRTQVAEARAVIDLR